MTTEIKPAPKQLAMLAVEMRGWDYEQIRSAILACSQAGWPDDRIYRETFRLLLREDASPADLLAAARTRPAAGPGEDTYSEGAAKARQMLAITYRAVTWQDVERAAARPTQKSGHPTTTAPTP